MRRRILFLLTALILLAGMAQIPGVIPGSVTASPPPLSTATNTATPSVAPTITDTPLPSLTPTATLSPTPYTCSCRKTCDEMSSCDEAYFQLEDCGCSRRDGDKDGVPCESICPGGRLAFAEHLCYGVGSRVIDEEIIIM